jgi:hypothetical protein
VLDVFYLCLKARFQVLGKHILTKYLESELEAESPQP